MYAVITEWEDGAVMVNGPYDELETANVAAFAIAHEEAGPDLGNCDVLRVDGGHTNPAMHHYQLGDEKTDTWDTMDVYVQEMGQPVDDATLAEHRDIMSHG